MSDKPLRVFISHPLSGYKTETVRRVVLDAALRVRKRGHYPFVPHLSPMDLAAEQEIGGEDADYHLTYDKQVWGYDAAFLATCEAILLLGRWWQSKGCQIELYLASCWKIRVVWEVHDLPKVDVPMFGYVKDAKEEYGGTPCT